MLEAESPRSGCQYGWVLGRAFFWVSDCCLLIVSSRDRKWVRESSWGASYKGTDPICEAPPSGPNHLSKASPPNIITLGVRISTLGGGVDRYSVHYRLLIFREQSNNAGAVGNCSSVGTQAQSSVPGSRQCNLDTHPWASLAPLVCSCSSNKFIFCFTYQGLVSTVCN